MAHSQATYYGIGTFFGITGGWENASSTLLSDTFRYKYLARRLLGKHSTNFEDQSQDNSHKHFSFITLLLKHQALGTQTQQSFALVFCNTSTTLPKANTKSTANMPGSAFWLTYKHDKAPRRPQVPEPEGTLAQLVARWNGTWDSLQVYLMLLIIIGVDFLWVFFC